jgi:hypothetical protein
MNRDYKTPSYTSPKNSKRGCLCKDTNTYSVECCDGSLWAQGIGSTGRAYNSLLQENRSYLLQENNSKITL